MNKDKAITVKNLTNTHLRRTIQKLEQQMNQAVSTAKFNEEVQRNIDGLDVLLSEPLHPEELLRSVVSGIQSRFGVRCATVSLGRNFFGELFDPAPMDRISRKRQGLDHIRTINEESLQLLFADGVRPVLRGNLDHGSADLFPVKQLKKIRSEAVLPILCDGRIVGTVNLGDLSPERFLDGLGTAFLQRLALTLSINLEKIFWKRRAEKPAGKPDAADHEKGPAPEEIREILEDLEEPLEELVRWADTFGNLPVKNPISQIDQAVRRLRSLQPVTAAAIPKKPKTDPKQNVIPLMKEPRPLTDGSTTTGG